MKKKWYEKKKWSRTRKTKIQWLRYCGARLVCYAADDAKDPVISDSPDTNVLKRNNLITDDILYLRIWKFKKFNSTHIKQIRWTIDQQEPLPTKVYIMRSLEHWFDYDHSRLQGAHKHLSYSHYRTENETDVNQIYLFASRCQFYHHTEAGLGKRRNIWYILG